MMLRLAATLALGLALAGPARAQQAVALPSHDAGVTLAAHWFPVTAVAPAGAVVLLHGCSGLLGPRGGLNQRMRDYATLVNRAGLHALVVDSFGPRGETEICTQRIGTRKVTQRNRRADALAALDFLATRSDVDPARLGLLGWSNGGSTVLAPPTCATPMSPRRVRSRRSRSPSLPAAKPICGAAMSRRRAC